jgi:SAM-dependent methyltransferase
MRGSAVEKLIRLASYLLRHPHDAARYARYSRSSPMELDVPWFSWPAIDYLENYINRDMRIFEYGSGGSTLFFAKNGASVVSVEDAPEWCRKVRSVIKQRKLSNVEIRYATFDKEKPELFCESEYLRALSEPYDVIVIDGSEDWPNTIVRPTCFAHAERYVAVDGIIVVDDAWRYDNLITKNRAQFHKKCEGTGPGRYGVTRTDIYFY